MERIEFDKREGYLNTVKFQGMIYNTTELDSGEVIEYWNEGAAYIFPDSEIEELQSATNELHAMSKEAAGFMAEEQKDKNSPFYLGITEEAGEYAIESLKRDDDFMYGRFDFIYDGNHPPKMIEYNADTPTAVVESTLVQWAWVMDRYDELGQMFGEEPDQFNMLEDKFIQFFKKQLAKNTGSDIMNFAHWDFDHDGEEIITSAFLREYAKTAGWDTVGMKMGDIEYNSNSGLFVNQFNEPIEHIFKLYPWEEMAFERLGSTLMKAQPTGWFQPAWVMFLSNKALNAALWHLYPNNKYLPETYVGEPRHMKNWIKKARFAREGDNMKINAPDLNLFLETDGDFGKEGYVYQEYVPLPDFPGDDFEHNNAVIGSWVVDNESAGICVRESSGPITDYYSRFCPHVVFSDDTVEDFEY